MCVHFLLVILFDQKCIVKHMDWLKCLEKYRFVLCHFITLMRVFHYVGAILKNMSRICNWNLYFSFTFFVNSSWAKASFHKHFMCTSYQTWQIKIILMFLVCQIQFTILHSMTMRKTVFAFSWKLSTRKHNIHFYLELFIAEYSCTRAIRSLVLLFSLAPFRGTRTHTRAHEVTSLI